MCIFSSPLPLQLISDAIHNMIVHGSDFSALDGLAAWIAAVHIVYSSTCRELHWFDQLTFQYPGIVYILLEDMPQMSHGDKGMVGMCVAVVFLLYHSAVLSSSFLS